MEKKYELLDKTKVIGNHVLRRIRALKSFGDVKKGEIGGFIESEANLSQEGSCWVYGESCVFEKGCVRDNATLRGGAWVHGSARILDNAKLYSCADIYNDARIMGQAEIHDHAAICSKAIIYGNVKIYDYANIGGEVIVSGEAIIRGNVTIDGNAYIRGKACITDDYSVFSINNIGSRNDTTTFFTDASGAIWVTCGCFFGNLDKFLAAVQETHGDNIHGRVYRLAAEMAKERLQGGCR